MLLKLLELDEELRIYVLQLLKRVWCDVAFVVLFRYRLPEFLGCADIIESLALLESLPLKIFLLYDYEHINLVKKFLHKAI